MTTSASVNDQPDDAAPTVQRPAVAASSEQERDRDVIADYRANRIVNVVRLAQAFDRALTAAVFECETLRNGLLATREVIDQVPCDAKFSQDCRSCGVLDILNGTLASTQAQQQAHPPSASPQSAPEGFGDRDALIGLIGDLSDDERCRLDHHGYCQTHSWMDESRCPHARARDVLRAASQAREASPPAPGLRPSAPPEGQPSEHEIARIARLLYLEQARRNGHDPDDEVWEQDRDAYMADARTAIPLFRRLYAGQA